MAVTVGQLSDALRITTRGNPEEPHLSILTRLLGVATATVEIVAPDAPEAVKDQSIIVFSAYLFDAPNAGVGQSYSSAFRNSGANSLLSRWISKRAGVAGEASSAAATGGDLSGEEIAERLDEFLGGQDWRTGGTVANIPAASASVRGGVLAVTNEIIDEGTSTGVFGWMLSHVRRVVNSIVPEWARIGNEAAIPADKLTNAPAGGGLTPGPVVQGVGANLGNLWVETAPVIPIPSDQFLVSIERYSPEPDLRTAPTMFLRADLSSGGGDGYQNVGTVPFPVGMNSGTGGFLVEEIDGVEILMAGNPAGNLMVAASAAVNVILRVRSL